MVADTNTEVLPADMNRQSIIIHNLDHSNNHILFVEFDAAATASAAGGCFAVVGPALELHVEDWPEIRGSVNLRSTSTTEYTVRTS